MGCDIHLAVEVRRDGEWQREAIVPEGSRDPWFVERAAEDPDGYCAKRVERTWYNDRNYEVFAVLADVRNNGEITPISDARGLPDDLSDDLRRLADSEEYNEDDIDLGDHSQSWLTLAELQAYPWDGRAERDGCVTLAEFMERVVKHGNALPLNVEAFPYHKWSGDIGGRNIVVRDAKQILDAIANGGFAAPADERTYVRDHWTMPVRAQAGAFTARLMPALASLDPDPRNVRIVFGFDS